MEKTSAEDSAFRLHYMNRKSMAATYLLTVAAKALYYDSVGVSHDVAVENMNNEAQINRTMLNEEISLKFVRKISTSDGICVKKRGRNGRFRRIYIKMSNICPEVSDLLEDSSLSDLSYLSWTSVWLIQKRFSLANLYITTVPEIRKEVIVADITSDGEINSEKTSSIPFIRLKNDSRNLDLQFENLTDYNGFLKYMAKVSCNDS